MILPDSRCRTVLTAKGAKQDEFGVWWVPVFCANCGKSRGWVTEESMRHCFFLCDPCSATHGQIEGTWTVPDEVFFAQARAEQMERYGRLLDPFEAAVEISKDETSPLALLARDLTRPARRA